MPDTPASLRKRAKDMRLCAAHSDDLSAYRREMAQAAELEERAHQLEAQQPAAKPAQNPIKKPPRSRRNAQLAKIHVAKKQLGLDDDTYRDLLHSAAGVRSASKLDPAGVARVLERLRALGWKDKASPRHGRRPNPPLSRAAQIRKIEALLADAGRPWDYADGIAKRVCKVDAVAFCDDSMLGKVIAALNYDKKRREARS